jgi:thiamine pyrophosphate-dependent acetolactate synthase large subunit-like protein
VDEREELPTLSQLTRGADVVVGTLVRAGVCKIFTLSGNHVMPVFDAALGSGIDLVHVRHEAAAVHMADAWARMTGEVGVALVTGGAGHANAIGALCTAGASESPVLLLSGHAALDEMGLGAFQEMRQADLAEPVTKTSWTARSAAELSGDIARAVRIAHSGQPGPVHVSLPFDVLERRIEAPVQWPAAAAFTAEPMPLARSEAGRILGEIAAAQRPLIIAPPALCTRRGRALIATLENAIGAPVIAMESPRGINDPALGCYAEVLAQTDLIVLLGKPLDFTLRFGRSPPLDPQCRFIAVEPDPAVAARLAKMPERVVCHTAADAGSAVAALIEAARARAGDASGSGAVAWLERVKESVAYRPPSWRHAQKREDAPVHPAELCRQVDDRLARTADAVFVSDGGEIGQWAQAIIAAPDRLINGPAGAIGASIPFAIAAKAARPEATVVAMLGDGSFGFHMAEFDTAVRYDLPFVAVVGNDARWNAEYQIQLRDYGANRAQGCTLAPATRYDLVATALGGHGELVTCAADLPAALDRAFASRKPACVNVLIESVAAPVMRRE